MIPVHYGEKDGEYWAFHEDGSLAVRGKYKFGNRVGLWREYYDGGRVKREVVYPNDPFDFKFSPYITREWDDRGTLIYDRAKFLKKSEFKALVPSEHYNDYREIQNLQHP